MLTRVLSAYSDIQNISLECCDIYKVMATRQYIPEHSDIQYIIQGEDSQTSSSLECE